MRKIALLHTVPSVYASFPAFVRENIPDVFLSNTVDEFLATDPRDRGEFTVQNLNRLHAFLRQAEQTGAEAIVVTCSTLSPKIGEIRPFIGIPVITIDGEMFRRAVAKGGKITVLATATTAVGPARDGVLRAAKEAGGEAEVEAIKVEGAHDAILRMDIETHDRLVLAEAAKIKGRDVVVLAQASMAHLEDAVAKTTGATTLSSPKLCMEELRRVLGL